jgi:predicted ArsR family transcriptional regulator
MKDDLTADLFANPGAWRRDDPPTSVAAALSIDVTPLEDKVEQAVRRLGGATSEEVAQLLGIERVTVSPRFAPLERKGRLIASEKRRVGKSGRASIVWMPNTSDVPTHHQGGHHG